MAPVAEGVEQVRARSGSQEGMVDVVTYSNVKSFDLAKVADT